jgi:hypothetical protein
LGFFLATTLLVAGSSGPVFAQEGWTLSPAKTTTNDAPLFRLPFSENIPEGDGFVRQQEHESEEEHEFEHKNELALIVAGTYESSEKDNHFTTGFEYERRLHHRIGGGVVFEYVTGIDAYLWVFQATYHVKGGFKVFFGPGIEREPRRGSEETGEHGDDHAETHEGEEPTGSQNLFLFRIGAGHSFEIGERYAISPSLALDFVNEEDEVATALVYGVTFSIIF